jgi:hypothetical protein
MQVTAIEGVVENGKIRLREPLSLAENTRVYVIVAGAPTAPTARIQSPRLANPAQADDFRKQILEITSDT